MFELFAGFVEMVLLAVFFLSTNDSLLAKVLGISTQATPAPTPIVTPQPALTVQPTSTTKPVYVNPDPVIDCNFTYIGTMKLRRSVCNKSTECQIGGKWVYYDSVDKCKADQANAQPKLVRCVLSYGTFNLTESDCLKYISANTAVPSNYTYSTTAPAVTNTVAPTETSTSDSFDVDAANAAIGAGLLQKRLSQCRALGIPEKYCLQ